MFNLFVAHTIKYLIASGIKLNAKNSEGSTTLDTVEMPHFANAEIKNMLISAKAKRVSNITHAPTRESWELRFTQTLVTT